MKPDIIMLTGGEPMFYPAQTVELIKSLKVMFPQTMVTLYTAKVDNVGDVRDVLKVADGMTLSLHSDKDVRAFQDFQHEFKYVNKSLFLNIFTDLRETLPLRPRLWKRVKIVEWVKNCPLPPQEDFRRLKNLWQ
jgi:organic radical activating enzyme